MTPPVDIAGLRGLVERASGLPWSTACRDGYGVVDIMNAGDTYVVTGGWDGDLVVSDEDAALLVAAVNALPALCDRVEELERDLAMHVRCLTADLRAADVENARLLSERDAARREIAIEAAEVTRLHEENARLRAEVAKWREHFGEGEVG